MRDKPAYFILKKQLNKQDIRMILDLERREKFVWDNYVIIISGSI